MCTSLCPCPRGDGQTTKDLWESYTESELRSTYKRRTGAYQTNDDYYGIIPFTWGLPANSNSEQPPTYATYKQCYDDVLKEKFTSSNTKQSIRNFFEKGGFTFLSGLEESYDCASICNVPLFYITRDISEGRPEQECV